MDWEALRDDYPTLQRTNYLNSCSLGALSNQSRAAHDQFFEQWTDLGASAWYELWLDEMDAWRKAVATMVGAKPNEVAWTYSTAAGLNSLVSALDRQNATGKGPFAGRTRTVASRLEFPSTMSAFGVGSHRGIDWIGGEGVSTEADAYAAAVGDQTQVVLSSSVFYATGARQPIQDIATVAKEAGALSVIDDYHGTGQLPVDFHDVGADVLTGGPLKWVCGGPVSAWMVVREDLIKDLEPQSAGWWADEGMFDFELEDFQWWPDAKRFEQGTVNMHGVFTSRPAIERINQLGRSNIRNRIRALAADLEERLEDAGCTLRSHPDPERRTGIIMVERNDPKADVKRLADAGIIVDDRPGCVRVSPHFYNTFDEGEAFVDAMTNQ